MLCSWSFIINLQWTSSRMLGCRMTLFELSVCWLARADADNAGVECERWGGQRGLWQGWRSTTKHGWTHSATIRAVTGFGRLQPSAETILRPVGHACWTLCGGVTQGEGGYQCELDVMMQTIQESQRHPQGKRTRAFHIVL